MDMKNLRISTMTQIAEISSKINLNNLYKYLEPTDTIRYLSFGSELSKGEITKKIKKPRKDKEKKFFYNQITIHIFFKKIVNVKIFNNGRIQMTGLKNSEQGKEVIEIFLEANEETVNTIDMVLYRLDIKKSNTTTTKDMDILNKVFLDSSVIKVWTNKEKKTIIKISIMYYGFEYVVTSNA